MLKFFSTIRKKLIQGSKVGSATSPAARYFFYAIGEILLVVIGILIALQINNWNENKNKQAHNKVILTNLISEFESNKIELKTSVNRIAEVANALDAILILISEKNPEISVNEFETLLEKSFTTPSWTPSSFVLEEMKASGDLSNIENNHLKQILFQWEREFSAMKSSEKGYDDYASEYIEFITKNGSVRNLDAIGGMIPTLKKSTIGQNNLTLLNSVEFENRVDNFYFLAYLLKEKYIGLEKTMDQIIKISKEEIND
jgi:hypothetical protein